MNKSIFWLGCLCLQFFPNFSKAQPAANVDSLKNVLAQPGHDTTKWNTLKSLVSHFQLVDPNAGKNYCFRWIEIGKRLGGDRQLEPILNLANLYSRINQLDSCETVVRQALEISRKLGNPVFEGQAHITLGGVFEKRGELKKAIESYQFALQKVKKPLDSIFTLNNLGVANTRQNQLEQALQAYLEALKIAERLNSERFIAIVSGNLSRVYEQMGKLPEAIRYLEKAIEIKEKNGDRAGLTYNFVNLGSLLFFKKVDEERGMDFMKKALETSTANRDTFLILKVLSDLSTMHLEKKQPESAAVFIQQGLVLAGNKPVYRESKASFFKNLAIIENEKSHFGLALGYGKLALENHPPEVADGLQDIYFEIFTALKGSGNYREALEIHEKYEVLKDSLNRVERLETVAELDAKYQAAEKDKSIAILEKDKLAQAAEISRRRNQLALVLAAAAGLFLLGGLLFFRNRYQNSLKLERLRTRIASDLHDEVGSSLSHLNFLIGSLDLAENPERTAQNLEKGKEIMQKTASDIRDVVWAIDARRDKTGDLLDRMEDFAFDMFAAKNISYQFLADGLDREATINPFVRQNIYLIFKEAINNIARHSTASEVKISIFQKENQLEMGIADNGKTANPKKVKGQGLENMQLRAQRIGGKLDIRQEADGFFVVLKTPVDLK